MVVARKQGVNRKRHAHSTAPLLLAIHFRRRQLSASAALPALALWLKKEMRSKSSTACHCTSAGEAYMTGPRTSSLMSSVAARTMHSMPQKRFDFLNFVSRLLQKPSPSQGEVISQISPTAMSTIQTLTSSVWEKAKSPSRAS